MLIPEVILYKILNAILTTVNDDYNNQTDKSKSILGLFFKEDDFGYPLAINTFNFFDQAVGVFIKNAANVRKLNINIGYNEERLGPPTVHIIMPSESAGGFTGIGEGIGYADETYDEISGETSKTYVDTYRADYNLLITSDNSNEMLIVYHLLKGMITTMTPQLGLMGILIPEKSGGDLQLDSSFAPPNIFHRNLTLSCQYESGYKTLFTGNKAASIVSQVCGNFADDFKEHNLESKDITGITKA